MNITYKHPVLTDAKGQQVGYLTDTGVVLVLPKTSGLVKGAIRAALKSPTAAFEVVTEFPPHGVQGEPATGLGLPHETRSEPQAEGGVSGASTPPPASTLPAVAYIENGITYIPVATPGEEGWVNDKTLKICKTK